MTSKLLAVLAIGGMAVAATPALAAGSAGLGDDPNPFLTDASFAPFSTADSLPGAYEMVSFQNAGLDGFDEINVDRAGLPKSFGNTPNRVAEPMSMAVFASGMLALVMSRRIRRKN